MKRTLLFCLITLLASITNAQETTPAPAKPVIKFNPFDGTIIAGYVDKGAFLNFTGPNISFIHKSSKWVLGMLPSCVTKKTTASLKIHPLRQVWVVD